MRIPFKVNLKSIILTNLEATFANLEATII